MFYAALLVLTSATTGGSPSQIHHHAGINHRRNGHSKRRHRKRADAKSLVPIGDVYIKSGDVSSAGDIKGIFYLHSGFPDDSGTWDLTPAPALYRASTPDTNDTRPWPFLQWTQVAKVAYTTKKNSRVVTFQTTDAKAMSAGMLLVSLDGAPEDPPMMSETTFAITDYPTTTITYAHRRIRIRSRGPLAPFITSPHIFFPENNVIPINIHRPLSDQDVAKGTKAEFYAHKGWNPCASVYGWYDTAGAPSVSTFYSDYNAEHWKEVDEAWGLDQDQSNMRHATVTYPDNYVYVMVFARDGTFVTGEKPKALECDGAMRKVK